MEKAVIHLPISREQVEAMPPSFLKAAYEEQLQYALRSFTPKTPKTKRSKPQSKTQEPPRRKGGNRRKGK